MYWVSLILHIPMSPHIPPHTSSVFRVALRRFDIFQLNMFPAEFPVALPRSQYMYILRFPAHSACVWVAKHHAHVICYVFRLHARKIPAREGSRSGIYIYIYSNHFGHSSQYSYILIGALGATSHNHFGHVVLFI